MRILLYNHVGEVSGAELSMLDLAVGLRDRGQAVVLACPRDGDLAHRAALAGIPTVAVPPLVVGYPRSPVDVAASLVGLRRAAVGVAAALQTSGAELLHANSVRAGIVAAVVRRPAATPLVVHVRDALGPQRWNAAIRAVLAWRADGLIAISRFAAAGLAWGDGLLARRLAARTRVIANPIDLDVFDPERVGGAAVRREFGLDGAYPVLLVVGQISPWKGQVDAVRAVAAVRKWFPAARLLVVGSTKFLVPSARYDNRRYDRELRRLVADLGLQEHVLFAGERRDVPALLAASDLLVLPSWAEPFGRVLVEAMAMGKPVVATAAGGAPEIVRPGDTGLLVPPKDPEALAAAIVELAYDPARAARLGQTGRQWARSAFSPAAHVAAVVDFYEALRRGERGSEGKGGARGKGKRGERGKGK